VCGSHKKARRVAGGAIWCSIIMITRGDVQRVMDAFILEVTLYWWLHPIERVNTGRGVDAWDGYHWTLARQLAQDKDWVSLKTYMDTMSETYLRETIEGLIQFESPRLYHEYWTACPATEEGRKRLLPTTTTRLSPKRARDHERVGQSGQNRLSIGT